jgi:ribosomal protein S18 acetylase RimI-like enzyme
MRLGSTEEATVLYDDAFADYPVMRFVLGGAEPYAARLHLLHAMWSREAELHRYLVLAVEIDGEVAAAATIVAPGTPTESPANDLVMAEAWAQLGADAKARYEIYGAAAHKVHSPRPGMYLDMLGVAHAHQGKGLARLLLEEVQRRSAAHPGSEGVLLTTENPVNVAFYEKFGYAVIAHERFGDGMETWGFFRPDDTPDRCPENGESPRNS